VKLSATVATDSKLQSLSVEADTRALFAQIAGSDDVVGVTGVLIAAARERHYGAVRIIDAERPQVAAATTEGAPPSTSGSRRRWAALMVAAVLLLMGFLVFRPGSTGPALDARADLPAGPQAPTSRPAAAPRKPTQAPSPGALTALPVIAIAAPKSMLSRARALAVASVLQKGLAGRPVALAPQGFGQANSVAPNTSDPGRARNRRVTIVLPTLR